MRFSIRLFVGVLLLSSLIAGAARTSIAQQEEHAVSPRDLRQDIQKASDERHANEAAIRDLLSTEQGQKAVKSSGADFQQVTKAVSQLSDEDAARLAAQSRAVQKDIAAGNFSDRDLLLILVVIAVIVLIIVAVR